MLNISKYSRFLCVASAIFLYSCGSSNTSETSLVQICKQHQSFQASKGTDVYNSTFLNGRDPELASEDVIKTCCPVYAKSALKISDKKLHELAYIRLAMGTDISQAERNDLMARRKKIESAVKKDALDDFWHKGAMQDFNACRKENFFPKMP